MASSNIYVLQCVDGKYYIGKSDNVEWRFQQHLKGSGSAWTKKYKPIKIMKVIPTTSSFEEDKQVKEYMLKYGIENVRGGSYVQEELDDETMRFLKKELYGATDCCSRCGRSNHFVKNCYASTHIDGNFIIETDDEEVVVCYRCGREDHYASDCYAKRHVNGRWIN